MIIDKLPHGGGIKVTINRSEQKNDLDFVSFSSYDTLPFKMQSANNIAVSYGGSIHIISGYYHFKFENDKWVKVSTPPYSLSYNKIVHDDCIIAMYNKNLIKWDGSTWSIISSDIPISGSNKLVSLNNDIHILGGNYSGSSSEDPTRHYKWDGTSWTSVSTIQWNILFGTVLTYDNAIHILGGVGNINNPAAATPELLYHYKWNGSSWVSVSTLPYPVHASCSVVFNNQIHIFGSGEPFSKYKHFIYSSSSWTIDKRGIPMYGCDYMSAVVYDNKIHLLGGSGYNNCLQHYCLDPGEWINRSIMRMDFKNGGSAVVGDAIFAIGGSATDKKYVTDMQYLDTKYLDFSSSRSWYRCRATPYNFYNGVAAVDATGCIHILGGTDNKKAHYKYNGVSWTQLSNLGYNVYGEYVKATTIVNEGNYDDVSYIIVAGSSDSNSYIYVVKSDTSSTTKVSLNYAYGACVLYYRKRLHFLGSNNTLSSYRYRHISLPISLDGSSVSTSSQISYGDIPINVYNGGAVVYHNEIHIFSGTNHYKWIGSSWTQVSTLPYAFSSNGVAVANDKIYIFGLDSGNGMPDHTYEWTDLKKYTGTSYVLQATS